MAFSFGASNQPTFGATNPQMKPMAFGTSFPIVPTTTAAGYSLGPTFGATQQPQQPQAPPQFGATTFGASPATTSTAAFPTFGGSTFMPQPGSAAATTSPLFGGFGKPTTAAPPTFGAAIPATKPTLFGQTAATGAAAPTANFLQSATTTTPSLFGGSAASTTPAASNIFGSTPSTNLFSGINFSNLGSTASATTTTATTATSSLFSGVPNLFGSGGGTTTTTPSSLFGSTTTPFSLGQPGHSTGFGFGTGAPTSSTNLFGQSAFGSKPALPATTATTNEATAQQAHQNQLILASIYAINVFNDERDDILKKWNILQACWGTGKGYYSTTNPPVEYDRYNPFYKFKAVGYNVIPQYDNIDGMVKFVFNKKLSELNSNRTVLVNGFNTILGSKPNLKVTIDSVKAISDGQTEVKLSVYEKGVTGSGRNIPANDLAAYFNQPAQKQQMVSASICQVIPLVTPSKSMLDDYVKTVPRGFDVQVWQTAVVDNPDPTKFIPVPIYGFTDLKIRKVMQDQESGRHKAYEMQIDKDIVELKQKHSISVAKLNELKERLLQLQHRTLKIMIKQESIRKSGCAIQPEEELLKGKLEALDSHLNMTMQFKGKLNEIVSTMRLGDPFKKNTQTMYTIAPESQTELKDFLYLQQNGIATLVDIIKDDLKCLSIITEGTHQMLQHK